MVKRGSMAKYLTVGYSNAAAAEKLIEAALIYGGNTNLNRAACSSSSRTTGKPEPDAIARGRLSVGDALAGPFALAHMALPVLKREHQLAIAARGQHASKTPVEAEPRNALCLAAVVVGRLLRRVLLVVVRNDH